MTRIVFLMALAMTIAGCESTGSRHSAGDSGLLPQDTTTVGPKADWVDNSDDGSTDGTINNDGSASPDASSDGQDVAVATEDVTAVLDCSTPPENCGLTEGQALICSGISGSPDNFWVFWSVEGCEWNMYGDDWPDKNGVIGSVPALEPEPWLEAFECVDALPEQ